MKQESKGVQTTEKFDFLVKQDSKKFEKIEKEEKEEKFEKAGIRPKQESKQVQTSEKSEVRSKQETRQVQTFENFDIIFEKMNIMWRDVSLQVKKRWKDFSLQADTEPSTIAESKYSSKSRTSRVSEQFTNKLFILEEFYNKISKY